MRVIIIGSGRVGAAIAHELTRRSHDVTVVDRDPDALFRLGTGFAGEFEVGDGLDSDLLDRLEIDRAEAFVAATSDDNTNIVLAQIARRRHNVENVVVRMMDPDKAAFYSDKGMQVICPTLRAIGEMIYSVDPYADAALRPEQIDQRAAESIMNAVAGGVNGDSADGTSSGVLG